MSNGKRVRRKIKDSLANLVDFEDLIETGGVAFSDGRCLELIKNDDLGSLAFLDSSSGTFLERIKLAGQTYVPPALAPSILEALTLPAKRTDCGSTVEMFAQIRNLFLDHGVSENAAQASAYFGLATWFADLLPLAPCVVLSGKEEESRVVLQLLGCIARHALRLAEVRVATFHGLPMHLQPTLLISYVDPLMWRVLLASNYPQAYLTNRNGLTDLYCAKAVYAGLTLGCVAGDSVLNINCPPSGGKLPVIQGSIQEKITGDFQAKLLDYRLKYVEQVRNADFAAPRLRTSLRMVARTLGACIIEAPELQAGIVRLLESQEEVLRDTTLLDPSRIAIEALFAHCHGGNDPIRVGVSEIASTATTIMADRGETTTVFETKKMGGHLRRLGFRAKRDAQGFAIHMTADVRRLIHRYARDQQIADSEPAVPGCPDCIACT